MGGLEGAVLQRIRPLAETQTWDYCVVWMLGDDPSRYIQWFGCCCAGAYDVKKERRVEHQTIPLCRDTFIEHPAMTTACEALARLPSYIPLYSGVHGEVVISTEPRWGSCIQDYSNSDQSHESNGTQVLIPVDGILIELFSTKHFPRDEKVIDFITSQINTITTEQESTISFTAKNPCPSPWKTPIHCRNLLPTIQASDYSNLEGPSTGSNPTYENPSLSASGSPQAMETMKNPNASRTLSCKQEIGIPFGRVNGNLKMSQRAEREQLGHSKNLVTERNRRNRIKTALFSLRALVPNITKMDRAAIIGDAIEYIEELKKKIKELQDELRAMEEEEGGGGGGGRGGGGEEEEEEEEEKNKRLEIPQLNAQQDRKSLSPSVPNDNPPWPEEKPTEVKVEVSQIGRRDLMLRLLCKQRSGGFARLMEAMNSLGLEVNHLSITSFKGKVLNILQIEVAEFIGKENLDEQVEAIKEVAKSLN